MSPANSRAIRRFGPRANTPQTAALKRVPEDFAVRQRLRQAGLDAAAALPGAVVPSRQELESQAEQLLGKLELPRAYLAFAMVMVANGWWLPRLRGISPSRRLLLLPRCLDGAAGDGAELAELRRRAQAAGYRTLVADGTPPVVRALAAGGIDGIVGVACMDSLEAVFGKIWQLGLPAVAVPLLDNTCCSTTADLPWLEDYLETRDAFAAAAAPAQMTSYLAALRQAAALFEPAALAALIARVEPPAHDSALSETADIARAWLAAGGKRLRPFITLAAAVAMAPPAAGLSPSLAAQLVALAVEAFHKASLAHDDIEDEDEQRYGQPTLYRQYGRAVAINVGDYLLGLGYRLLCAAGRELPPAAAAGIVEQMSQAHVLLAQGQGAELAWRREGAAMPRSAEVLHCYALKTAPAFAAALSCGVLLGGGQSGAVRPLEIFSRHVGVGFQVLNDLSDWRDDLRAARPTYLTAIAAEACTDDAARAKLLAAIRAAGGSADEPPVAAAAGRLEELGAFATAEALVERLRQRAGELAARLEPAALGQLCGYLTELILA
jgi:geranylgeranyl pyrophosphate synthase